MAGESASEVARRAREKAAQLERYAEAFERVAAGEASTASALSSLPPEWVVLHDLRWPGRQLANIDHLVVGPGGVFVIDTKNWSGTVTVRDGVLRQNGRSREKIVADCAEAALAVGRLIPMYASYVHPVLCFVGDDSVAGVTRGVTVCCQSRLTEMLTTRPRVFGPTHVDYVSNALKVHMPMATQPSRPSRPGPRRQPSPGIPVSVQAPAPPTRRSGSQGSRRGRGGTALQALLGLALLAAAFIPQVREPLTSAVVDLIVPEPAATGCGPGETEQADGTCRPAETQGKRERPNRNDEESGGDAP